MKKTGLENINILLPLSGSGWHLNVYQKCGLTTVPLWCATWKRWRCSVDPLKRCIYGEGEQVGQNSYRRGVWGLIPILKVYKVKIAAMLT